MSDSPSSYPRHIAIIMDGNGRWAKKRFLPRYMGHRAGVETVRSTVKQCAERGIAVLTLFAFSSENWRRPADEVDQLMQLLTSVLETEVDKLHDNNIKLRIIGERSAFSSHLQNLIVAAEQKTCANTGLNLVMAVNYGGRWDISQALQHWVQDHFSQLNEETTLASVREVDLQPYLCLSDLPEPDLFIRTGGEQRISNFLLWQLAYTELYFTDVLWPDFNTTCLQKALDDFAQRQRRFGQTSEQVTGRT